MTRLFLAAACVASLTCNDGPTEPTPDEVVKVLPEWVTGEAAAALDVETGQFNLVRPAGLYVSAAGAEMLALAVARYYASGQVGNAPLIVQQDRGGPIDFNTLSLCARVTYVGTPFGIPPAPVPGWARRSLSAQWAIPLCGVDQTVHMSVGVPDAPMDVRVEDAGIVFRDKGGGSDFTTTGVPVIYANGLPLSPEQAVAAVIARAPSRRVTHVPMAYNQQDAQGIGELPLCASWRILLDGSVSVRSEQTGSIRAENVLYVRRTPACFSSTVAFYVAAIAQPTSQWIRFPKDTSGAGTVSVLDSAQVALIGPTVFNRVTIVP